MGSETCASAVWGREIMMKEQLDVQQAMMFALEVDWWGERAGEVDVESEMLQEALRLERANNLFGELQWENPHPF